MTDSIPNQSTKSARGTPRGSVTEEAAPRATTGNFRALGLFLLRRKGALFGLVGTVLIALIAVFAPTIAPHNPLELDITQGLLPPIWNEGSAPDHLLGTDALGRDILSRIIWGARYSLTISLLSVAIGSSLGFFLGLISGFFGKWVDAIIMRLGDIQLAFPFLLFAIAVLAVSPERNIWNLSLVMGFAQWIVYARLVRSKVLSEKEKDYTRAARALGASPIRVLVRYVLPNSWQIVPVVAMLQIGGFVVVESTLSFLNLGLTPPIPSWGAILSDGRQYMVVSPYMPLLPGLAILITVLCINLASDGLADFFDPKLAKGGFRRYPLGLLPELHEPQREPLLRVRDVTTVFPMEEQVVTAVNRVSFDLERGQILGIVGESGSGKSTLGLSIIQLLDAPGRVVNGQILFQGKDLTRIGDHEMRQVRGKHVGMIFQNPGSSLNPVLSVGYQLRETLQRHHTLSDEVATRRAQEALEAVGIADLQRVLRAFPFELSGGMQQRVMIALAMSCEPELLIADEPSTALDVTTQVQLLDRLDEMRKKTGTSIILITHDIALLADFADVFMIMYAGQVCEMGQRKQVIEAPQHPYTKALLDSVARTDVPGNQRLAAIPGDPPDPSEVPPGCPFAPRCPRVMPICREANPGIMTLGAGHTVACHLLTAKSA